MIQHSSLLRIVTHSLEQARNAGLDQLSQSRQAARAVMQIEPGLTEGAALKLVEVLTSRG